MVGGRFSLSGYISATWLDVFVTPIGITGAKLTAPPTSTPPPPHPHRDGDLVLPPERKAPPMKRIAAALALAAVTVLGVSVTADDDGAGVTSAARSWR